MIQEEDRKKKKRSEESEEEEYEGKDSIDGMWYPDEDSLDILTNELWKKCVRIDNQGIPYYNLGSEYIKEGLSYYFDSTLNRKKEIYGMAQGNIL